MEPMALGSPPSSPSSPSINPTFLPSFLLGEAQPASPNPNISPGRNRTPTFKPTISTPSDTKSLRQKLFSQSLMESTYNHSSPYTIDKVGPPKQALFDTIDKNNCTSILNSTMQNGTEKPVFTPNESFSRIGNDSLNYSQAVTNLNESINKSHVSHTPRNVRTENNDSLWVTVFGFPPSATSLVLAQLANCGCIVEKKFPTQGNWINLKYSSAHEVAKALCMNGKLLSSNIMIGVVLFHNRQENKENMNNCSFTSPLKARSLRHSFVSPQNSNTVVPQNLPQKSTGLVTKAMEYVFGW